MTNPGSQLKWDRAHKHLNDATAAASQFLQSNPYRIVRDEESEPGKLLYWITLLKDPPPEIALAAGDAIHNMRSALDHIVYELSTKRKKNPRDTSFPLHKEEADWDKRGRHQVRLLPNEAITYIYNVQPWPRPQPFRPDMFGPNRQRLRELHELDIADKHKTLNLAVLYVGMMGIGTEKHSDDIRFENAHEGPLEPYARTQLARLAYPRKVHVEPLPNLDVVFSEESMPNEPIESKLNDLFRNVTMVLNKLSRFA